jgi:hypothetical protein
MRQNSTLDVGKSAVGRAEAPVASSVATTIEHARSLHTCTRAPSTPTGSDQRSVGRKLVTVLVTGGNTGLGATTSQPIPLRSKPGKHSTPHAPAVHVAREPVGAGHGSQRIPHDATLSSGTQAPLQTCVAAPQLS